MSMARRCDRCGGYFSPETEKGEYCRFSNPTIMDGGSFSKIQIKYKLCYQADVDLCPKCTWLMKKFMQNKKFVVYMDDGETVEEFMDEYLDTSNEINKSRSEEQEDPNSQDVLNIVYKTSQDKRFSTQEKQAP